MENQKNKNRVLKKCNPLILLNKISLFLKKNRCEPKVFCHMSDNPFAYGKFAFKKEFANLQMSQTRDLGLRRL